jgi:type I restriction enzyme S subunit
MCLRLACQHHFPMKPIGTIAHVVSGGTPDTGDPAMWDGDVVWVTPRDLGRPRTIEVDDSERHVTQQGIPGRRLLPAGAVLLSSRAPIGHLGIANRQLCTNQGFKNIICSPALHSRYLFHLLRACIDELEAEGRGNTFKEIPTRVVQKFEIPVPPLGHQIAIVEFLDSFYLRLSGDRVPLPPLPSPLEDQRRIVARIEEVAEKIDAASSLQQSTIEETQALLAAAVGRVFHELEIAHGATTFGTLQPHVTSGPRDWAKQYSDSGFRFYRAQDISADGSISQANAIHLDPPETAQGRLAKLETGDLMLVITGATVGRVAVFSEDCEPGFASQHVAICRVPSGKCLPRYVWWGLRAPQGQQQLLGQRYGQGKPGLNLANIRSLAVPLPSLLVQQQAVDHLDKVRTRMDALSSHQSAVRKELAALLPSILDKAFRGEL